MCLFAFGSPFYIFLFSVSIYINLCRSSLFIRRLVLFFPLSLCISAVVVMRSYRSIVCVVDVLLFAKYYIYIFFPYYYCYYFLFIFFFVGEKKRAKWKALELFTAIVSANISIGGLANVDDAMVLCQFVDVN